MRKKPTLTEMEKKFIENASFEKEEDASLNIKSFDHTKRTKWPLQDSIVLDPIMEQGSELRKPVTIPLKEFEWNTIDKHIKKLGVGKSEWIRHAIYLLLNQEQKYYFGEE